jgi:hypothetical protein
MNWYRRSQDSSHYEDTGGKEYDLFDAVDSHRDEIMGDYHSEDRVPGSMMSWNVVPFPRLKKIWEDFMKHSVIHDEKGLMRIRDMFIDNIARLQAATDISGHSQYGMGGEGTDHPVVKDDDIDFYQDYLDTPHGTPISDYGLKPLWNLAHELMTTQDPTETLVLLDRMLNVIHCRGDIASLFVDGGSDSLNELFGRPCGLNRYDEEA